MKSIVLGLSPVILFAAAAAIADPADQPGHRSPVPGSSSETMSAAEDSVGHWIGTVSAEMTTTSQGFVTAAAVSDMYEVEAGKIAVNRATSPAVRDFGRQMVVAHTETTSELKGILASANLHVTPPAHLDDRRQGMIDNLRGASAGDFDHRYLVQQEAAHREAVILMRGYARNGDNSAVKRFAAETLPKVEQHLAMVRKLEQTETAAR